MEVFILGFLAVAISAIAFKLHLDNKKSKDELDSLGSLLEYTLKDYERSLEDHKNSERELSIIKAKLEGMRETSLTPDNAVPKDMHIEKVLELSSKLTDTERVLQDTKRKFEEARGKAISERVRLGAVGETFAAFHAQFPYNRQTTKALFQPIDLICFEENEIIFIDVKTGGSQLSKKQRNIRDNIKKGNVRFEVHRLDDEGYKIKREE